MKLSKEARAHWTKEQRRDYKLFGALPEESKIENTIVPVIKKIPETITVLCVRFGNRYGREYVERLRNMVSRHLTVPYEFMCLTDDHHPIDGVKSIVRPNEGYAKGWWHKVHMFDPSLGLKGRVLYFDLDIVIHNNIDKLVENFQSEFLGIRDFNRKFNPQWNILNSSIMSWPAGLHPDIFTTFKTNPKQAQKLHGDQDWIWNIAKSRITFWPESWIQSYKWEIRDRNDTIFQNGKRSFRSIKNPKIPDSCCVCVFHGDPKPEDVQDPFVVDNWR
jgi:hypothetical protein